MRCPSQVAKIAPTMPSKVVTMNPPGPATKSLAIAPAIKPMMMTHSQCSTVPLHSAGSEAYGFGLRCRGWSTRLLHEAQHGNVIGFAGAEQRQALDFNHLARHGDFGQAQTLGG